MHHITSSVTYRDLKLLELNSMWEATNQMMRLLIEQKITWLFSESSDFEDSMMHKKRSLNAQPQNTFCAYRGLGEPQQAVRGNG